MINYYLQKEERKRNQQITQNNHVFIPYSWHSTQLAISNWVQQTDYAKYPNSEFKHKCNYVPSTAQEQYTDSLSRTYKIVNPYYHLSDTRTKSDNSYMIESFSIQNQDSHQKNEKSLKRGEDKNESISPRFQIRDEICKTNKEIIQKKKVKKQNQRNPIFEPIQFRQVERSLLDELSSSNAKEIIQDDSPQKNSLMDELLSHSYRKENSQSAQYEQSPYTYQTRKWKGKSPKKASSPQMQQKFLLDEMMTDSLVEPNIPQVKERENYNQQKQTSEKASQFDIKCKNSFTQTGDGKQSVWNQYKELAVQTDVIFKSPQKALHKDTQTQTRSIFSPILPKSYYLIQQQKFPSVKPQPEVITNKEFKDQATITNAEWQINSPKKERKYSENQHQQPDQIPKNKHQPQSQEKQNIIVEQQESQKADGQFFGGVFIDQDDQYHKEQNFQHEQNFSTFNPKNTEFSSTISSNYDLIEGQIFNYNIPENLQPTPTYTVPKKQWVQKENEYALVYQQQRRDFSFENESNRFDRQKQHSKSQSKSKSRSNSHSLHKQEKQQNNKTYAEIFETLRKNKNPNKSVNRLTYSTNETLRYIQKTNESLVNQEICQRFLAHHQVKTLQEYDLKITKNSPQNGQMKKNYSPQKGDRDRNNAQQPKTLLDSFKQKLSKV